ncbi:MAG: hypothetical protein CMO44_13000 [Verrucomicrobiales bacterium]|nr:hypothetical protein [Verrucomicrobiales bacterium]|tara:strand:- start:24528 stop:24980 length:453 start_codon:yes stop_codon:yes gene_type:complete
MEIANLINPYDEKFHKGNAVQKPLPQIKENTIMAVERKMDMDEDSRQFVTVDKLYDIWNFQKVSKNTDTIVQTLSPSPVIIEDEIVENDDDTSLIVVIVCALVLMYVFYIFFNLRTKKMKPTPAKIARPTPPMQTKITPTTYDIPTPIIN